MVGLAKMVVCGFVMCFERMNQLSILNASIKIRGKLATNIINQLPQLIFLIHFRTSLRCILAKKKIRIKIQFSVFPCKS